MNITILKIEGKNIYLAENHHEVILAWAEERKKLETLPSILTLDHHTDTLPAFTHATEKDGNKIFLS